LKQPFILVYLHSLLQKNNPMDKTILIDLVKTRMPYGKYKGRVLCDLPEFYLSWYHQKGFPEGKIGMLLSTLYEIKLNGLEYLLKPLR
jgi:uncharacterized protein (DUF3820 family)